LKRRVLVKAAVTAVVVGGLPRFARTATAGRKTKIGIVGSGMVGSALGGVWVRAGHEVMFSSLDIEHDKALAARLGPNARAGTPREAAIGASRMGEAHREPGRIGMPVAADDAAAIEIASRLIRDIGYEPVPVGGLAMGKYLMPGTPLAGEHSPAEIRRIAATLKK
jgi:predicted dinucleotide-binding enzyme